MPPIDRLASQLRRRIIIGEFLRLAGRWFAIALLLFGLVVLGAKLFAPEFWPRVLWMACLSPLLAAWLVRRASRLAPAGSELISLLDDRLAAGGLLMTLSERPDPRWEGVLPNIDRNHQALPAIIPEPFVRAIAVPLMFAAGALALSSPETPPVPRATLAGDVTRELDTALGVLQKNNAVDPATSADLAREVEQLTSSIEGGPLTNESWETVDALRGRMGAALDATDQSLFQGEMAISTLANGLAQFESMSPEDMARLERELDETLKILEHRGALEELPERLPEIISQSGQSPAAGEVVRKLLDDPATRRLTLSAIGTLLSRERDELSRTREQIAAMLGSSPSEPTDAFSESAGPPPSPPAMREFREISHQLGGTLMPLQEIPLSVDGPAPVIPGGDTPSVPSGGQDAESSKDAAGDRSPLLADAPPAANGKDTNIPTEIFSRSTSWKRQLRPRHRDVVRGYFGDG